MKINLQCVLAALETSGDMVTSVAAARSDDLKIPFTDLAFNNYGMTMKNSTCARLQLTGVTRWSLNMLKTQWLMCDASKK